MTAPALHQEAGPVRQVEPAGSARRGKDGGPARHGKEQCLKVSQVLSRVGDKWTVLVITLLQRGPHRFGELKRAIEDVSQRMLTLTLRGLERDGLVNRTVTPSIPPRVDYELTSLGRSLAEPVQALCGWAYSHVGEIDAERLRYDRRLEGATVPPRAAAPLAGPET